MNLIYRLADFFADRFDELKSRWKRKRDELGYSLLESILYFVAVCVGLYLAWLIVGAIVRATL